MDKTIFRVYERYYDNGYYISDPDGVRGYLHKDGKVKSGLSPLDMGYWKDEQEAENFLRNWQMAKLECNDGTVINISSETEAELRKAFEYQPTKVGDYIKYLPTNGIYILSYGGVFNQVRAVNLCNGDYRSFGVTVKKTSSISKEEMNGIMGSNNWKLVDRDYVKQNL